MLSLPQGNRVIERIHRTLNAITSKTNEKRGNWAAVMPMTLYFVRRSPCCATGMSLFMDRQGWEPAMPVQLLYKELDQTDLGEVNLEEWLMCNPDRVEALRDKATVSKQKVSKNRKLAWDAKAKDRKFDVCDMVLVRKLGINTKLSESWEGPFRILRKNSPPSYRVDLGDRVLPSVHVSLMKRFVSSEDSPESRESPLSLSLTHPETISLTGTRRSRCWVANLKVNRQKTLE